METHNKNTIIIFKEHIDIQTKKKLSISEIFDRDLSVAFKSELFKNKNVELVHNSAEDIKQTVIEMDERLNGTLKIQKKKYQCKINFGKILKELQKEDFKRYEAIEGKQHGILNSNFKEFLKKIKSKLNNFKKLKIYLKFFINILFN